MLDGYRSTIKMGGSPIALAEEEHILQSLGIAELKSPEHFWRNLNRLPPSRRRCPALARQARSRSFSESNQWLVNPSTLIGFESIAISDWPKKRDELTLIHSMGREAANVHLSKNTRVDKILAH
jgi:hypothetical protein